MEAFFFLSCISVLLILACLISFSADSFLGCFFLSFLFVCGLLGGRGGVGGSGLIFFFFVFFFCNHHMKCFHVLSQRFIALIKMHMCSCTWTVDRYRDFRYPPWHEDKYGYSDVFWHVLAARLAFVVVFEVSTELLPEQCTAWALWYCTEFMQGIWAVFAVFVWDGCRKHVDILILVCKLSFYIIQLIFDPWVIFYYYYYY